VCADHDIVHGYENQINCITIGKQPHQSLYFTFGLFQPQALLKGTPVCGQRAGTQKKSLLSKRFKHLSNLF